MSGRHANVAFFVPHGGCPRRCVFCDQRSISGRARMPDRAQVEETLERARQNLGERVRQSEIAFFGGSFTAIPRADMTALLEWAQPFLGPGGFGGIRISTRPDAMGEDVLKLLAEYGVTAIELGAQSMDDRVLEQSGRGHAAHDVEQAARRIRGRGFSLGLQMMTGLPGDRDEGALRTLDRLLALSPDTLRIYPTLVLRNTGLEAFWRAGAYRPQTLEAAVELCASLLQRCDDAGVRVIRLGLHDSRSLTQQLLAGPHHPALRELCESRVLLEQALAQLRDRPPGPVLLAVAPGSVSRMTGQKRCNLLCLERLGWQARVAENPDMKYLKVRVE